MRGRRPKIRYATQVAVAPPTFVLFSTDPAAVHFSYRRYLENRLRDAYASPARRSASCSARDREQRPREVGAGPARVAADVARRYDHRRRTASTLERILHGFDAHDAVAILEDFTDDAVFDAPRVPDSGGTRYEGREAIRAASRAFPGILDIRYEDDRSFVAGDRGVSEWTIRGHTADGAAIEVRGCDLWEFEGAKVRRKDSYWKRLYP